MSENEEEITIEDERGFYVVLVACMLAAIIVLASIETYPIISITFLIIIIFILGFYSYREIYKSKNKIQISPLGCKYNEEFFPWESIYYVSKNLVTGFEFKSYLDSEIYYRSVFIPRKSEKEVINLDLYPSIKSRIDAVENISDIKRINFSRSTKAFLELSICSSIVMLTWFVGLICSLKYQYYFVIKSTVEIASIFYIVLFILLQFGIHRWVLGVHHYEFKTKIKQIIFRTVGVLFITLLTTFSAKEIMLAYNYSEIISTRVNTFSVFDINYVQRSSKASSWFIYETKFVNQLNNNEKYTFDLSLKCGDYLKLRKKADFYFYKGKLGLEFINSTLVKKLDDCGLY